MQKIRPLDKPGDENLAVAERGGFPLSLGFHARGAPGGFPGIGLVSGLRRGNGKAAERLVLAFFAPSLQIEGSPVGNLIVKNGLSNHLVYIGSCYGVRSQPLVNSCRKRKIVTDFKARQVAVAEIPLRVAVHGHQVEVPAQLGRAAESRQAQEDEGQGPAAHPVAFPVAAAGHVGEQKAQETGPQEQVNSGRNTRGGKAEVFYLVVQPHRDAGGDPALSGQRE